MKKIAYIFTLILLNACNLSPVYEKPTVEIPRSFKEGTVTWKGATPKDFENRANWWELFQDPILNNLQQDLLKNNHSIELAKAQYLESLEVVKEAKGSYFPTLNLTTADTRAKTISTSKKPFPATTANSATVSFQTSWEPDFWGSVQNSVSQGQENAESNLAQIALSRVSAQASLAQYYFQLRILDEIQEVWDEVLKTYDQYLAFRTNSLAHGVVSPAEFFQAKAQQDSARLQATDNTIARAQYEHAIAVLLGRNPSAFSIKREKSSYVIPRVPTVIPSDLLQRRPDIAKAERFMASANAQIGINKAAYFPSVSLSGSRGAQLASFSQLFTSPNLVWSLGLQLTQSIFQGGKQLSQVRASNQAYKQQVASYKQTVLTVFQEVEDALVTVKILDEEAVFQDGALNATERQGSIIKNQYTAGTASQADIATSLFNVYTTRQSALTLKGKRLQAAVTLIKVLGGGWNGLEQEEKTQEKTLSGEGSATK